MRALTAACEDPTDNQPWLSRLTCQAAANAEIERQQKASEWLLPPEQIYCEIALRMQREWAAMDAAAVRAATASAG